MANTLICTVGLPRAGKSTWARQQGFPIVSPDAIRIAIHGQPFYPAAEPLVWATAWTMAAALFLAGHDTVILDSTNTTRKRRDECRKAGKIHGWTCVFKEIKTDVATCLDRCLESPDLVPVVKRMMDQYEEIGEDEEQLSEIWGT